MNRQGEGRMQPPRRSRGTSIPWITVAIGVATFVGAWMFRYETLNNGTMHRNRFTGAICMVDQECWRGTLPLDLVSPKR
jgi:hypothetical protein